MKSQWFELKPAALVLRAKGRSLRFIEANLGVPRSTLSGWLRETVLTEPQQHNLMSAKQAALSKARQSAAARHNRERLARIQEAEANATKTLASITVSTEVTALALAMLYGGKGKKTQPTAMGSSDPEVLKFFVSALEHCYGATSQELTYTLRLRHGQSEEIEKAYWATELGVPLDALKLIYSGYRGRGTALIPYHGLCTVQCSRIAIQRKLVYLYKLFCEASLKQRAISSAG